MRVKSLTPPLPSVLPMTAITSSAVNCPALIRSSTPLASCTVLSSTFATSIAILSPDPSAHPRRALAAQHLLVALTAVDHWQRRTARAQRHPQLGRRRRIDTIPVGFASLRQNNPIAVACRR